MQSSNLNYFWCSRRCDGNCEGGNKYGDPEVSSAKTRLYIQSIKTRTCARPYFYRSNTYVCIRLQVLTWKRSPFLSPSPHMHAPPDSVCRFVSITRHVIIMDLRHFVFADLCTNSSETINFKIGWCGPFQPNQWLAALFSVLVHKRFTNNFL